MHSVCTKLIYFPKCSVSDRQQEAPERHRRHREIVASAEQPNMNSLCAKVISLPLYLKGTMRCMSVSVLKIAENTQEI